MKRNEWDGISRAEALRRLLALEAELEVLRLRDRLVRRDAANAPAPWYWRVIQWFRRGAR